MVSNEIPDVPLRDERAPKPHFVEEREGWHGYIEWEKYPEKQKKAAGILAQYKFAPVICTREDIWISSSSITDAACDMIGT